ncbi:hypothetical protein CPB83DRAFT_903444 [Crepidotus variabilis]|uniref:C3H1-type domain-containing protein n=1 Tax=Crepidotus variabilis TaxID=179855 RepID=A0A9P6EQQ6_9AGAR|nr:hypothetical protein CPB83DRAFT_903444 [Crepidotus variabilis]
MAFWKTMPCRHFDSKTGVPLGSGCEKGKDCRWVHPDEPGWPAKQRNGGGSTSKTPLIAQASLFQKIYQDRREGSPLRGRERRASTNQSLRRAPGPRRRRSRSNSRGYERRRSPSSEISAYRGPRKASEPKGRHSIQRDVGPDRRAAAKLKPIVKVEDQQFRLEANNKHSEPSGSKASVSDIAVSNLKLSPGDHKKERSERISAALLHLARLSRESDRLTERLISEETKCATYTTISDRLRKISGDLTTTVEPKIAESSRVQDDCEAELKKHEAEMKRIWTEAVQELSSEVARTIDDHVQIALQQIRNEAEKLQSEVSDGVSMKKRNFESTSLSAGYSPDTGPNWLSLTATGDSSSTISEAGEIFNGTKRRRIRPSSPHSPRGTPDKNGGSMLEQLQAEMIRDMKLKIDEQAKILTGLAKENDKLREDAQKQTLRTPSPSPVPWTVSVSVTPGKNIQT